MGKQTRTALLIFTFLSAAVSGWRLWDLFQKDILWGYLPLFFFAAVWIFIMGMLTQKTKDNPARNRRLLLSTLSGLMLAVAFPNTIPDFFTEKPCCSLSHMCRFC